MLRSVTSVGAPPAFASTFVGRQDALDAIREAFAAGARLVSILGPGGMGKTRLAAEHARRLAAEEPGGVLFCDLSAARSVEGVCSSVAATLEISLRGETSAEEAAARIGEALAERPPTLVVLDNFEQVAFAAADTVGRWLRAGGETRFVVTSRERLGLDGEVLLDLRPLPLADDTGDSESSDAVQLFCQRARAVRRGFDPAGQGRALAEIVAELDGIPLAIELAAARLRTLSLTQLHTHLSKRFELLTSRSRDRVGRHATLEAAIEWSWNLLDDEERDALCRLSIFHDGFTVEGAEAVVGAAAMDLVETLRDKSLLVAREPEHEDQPLRFGFYASIRDYAQRKLDAASAADAHRKHAAHFALRGLALAERAERDDGARRALTADLEALLAAFRWAVEAGEGETALRLALAALPIFRSRGPNHVYLEVFDGALGAPGISTAPAALRLRAHLGRAEARVRRGDLDSAREDLALAEALAADSDDGRDRAQVERTIGALEWARGFLREATEHFRAAVTLSEAAGDEEGAGHALTELGRAALLSGDIEEAAALWARALEIHRRLGDRAHEARTLANLGNLELDRNRLDDAVARATRAASLAEEVGDPYVVAVATMLLGEVAVARESLDEARGLYEQALEGFRRIGRKQSTGLALAYLGACFEERGDLLAARARYDEAAMLLRDSENLLGEGLVSAWSGRLRATRDELEAAEADLDHAAECMERVGDTVRWEVAHLCRGHLDLARARAAESRDDLSAASGYLDEAQKRVRAARKGRLSQRSADVRAALRVLERAVGAPEHATIPPPAEPSLGLRVGTNGKRFRPPGGEVVDISRRGALALLLSALAKQRVTDPGVAIGVADMFEMGWPGQKALPRSASSRVYVAMSTLRGLGLRDVLVRHHEGYLLEPSVPIEIGDDDL